MQKLVRRGKVIVEEVATRYFSRRTALATGSSAVAWNDVTGKPEAFTPSTHAHATTDITGTAVVTTDARLTDARTPTTHDNTKHSAAYLVDASSDGTTYGRKNGAWEAISAGGLTHPQVLARGLGA